MGKPTWHFKLERAQKHLDELEREIDRYCEGRFYRAVCPKPPRPESAEWEFNLEITSQPSQRLAVILGDVLFNLRSALDHVAVAIAPKKAQRSAGFPIVRDYKDRDAEFVARIKGMPAGAVKLIEQYQPYNKIDLSNREGRLYSLAALSALQNADKHRRLAVLLVGIIDPTVTISWPSDTMSIMSPAYLAPGAVVLHSAEIGNRIAYRDVSVSLRGQVAVSVVIGGKHDYALPDIADGMLIFIRDRLIPELEPYAR